LGMYVQMGKFTSHGNLSSFITILFLKLSIDMYIIT
jgi:hypothetical protein